MKSKKLPALVNIPSAPKGLCAPSYFNLVTGEKKRPDYGHVCERPYSIKHACEPLPEIYTKPPNCS